MNILLMTPTRVVSKAALPEIERVFTVSEPLGLAYLAAVLRENGYHVEVLDALAEGFDTDILSAFLAGKQFDIVGVTTYTASVKTVIEDLRVIRQVLPSAMLGIGGPHPNAMQRMNRGRELVQNISEADFAVYGEGEISLLEVVQSLESGRDLSGIPGVIWRAPEGVEVNPPRELIRDLDTIPFPAIALFPLEKYRRTPASYRRQPVRSVITTRGCPYECIFCDRGAMGRVVRRRSVDNVCKEIEILVERFGTKEIRFWDDVLTIDDGYVSELCERLREYDLLWSCNARVNLINPQTLRRMKEAGCWQVDLGIESGNDRILKVIRKKFTVQEASEAVRMAKEAGLETRAFFILGFPEETEETVRDTIHFALDNDLDYATFYLPQAYPGTELYDIALKEKSLGSEDLSDYLITGSIPSYLNPSIALERLQALQREAYRRFYRRPSYLVRSLLKIRTWEDVKRYVNAISVLRI